MEKYLTILMLFGCVWITMFISHYTTQNVKIEITPPSIEIVHK